MSYKKRKKTKLKTKKLLKSKKSNLIFYIFFITITFIVVAIACNYSFLYLRIKNAIIILKTISLESFFYLVAIIAIIFCCVNLLVLFFKQQLILNKPLCKIDIMTGEEFEIFLKHHFKKMGYKVTMTPISNDYGADLILRKKRQKICVQAKRYKSSVGNSAVQEVCAAMAYYKCNAGMVITNSYFTTNAKNLAKANNIELWDRNTIIKKFNIRTK